MRVNAALRTLAGALTAYHDANDIVPEFSENEEAALEILRVSSIGNVDEIGLVAEVMNKHKIQFSSHLRPEGFENAENRAKTIFGTCVLKTDDGGFIAVFGFLDSSVVARV